jgi:hypothetical protein
MTTTLTLVADLAHCPGLALARARALGFDPSVVVYSPSLATPLGVSALSLVDALTGPGFPFLDVVCAYTVGWDDGLLYDASVDLDRLVRDYFAGRLAVTDLAA